MTLVRPGTLPSASRSTVATVTTPGRVAAVEVPAREAEGLAAAVAPRAPALAHPAREGLGADDALLLVLERVVGGEQLLAVALPILHLGVEAHARRPVEGLGEHHAQPPVHP